MDRYLAVVAVCCLAVAIAAVPPAGADHGSPSNFTVVPYDRNPGAQSATYEQHAVSPIGFQYLDYIEATWQEGSFADCGATNSETFGIDRGNDAPGTQTDHDLKQHVEETTVTEDKFVANFYEKDDAVGSSTHFAKGDEFVSVTTDCFTNPQEPGWYQISSKIGGTAENGSYVEASDISHYFYICECSNEQEARKKLGPPPSESMATTTASATASATETAEPTPTRTPPDEGTPFPTPTATATLAETTGSGNGGAGDVGGTDEAGGATAGGSTGDDRTTTERGGGSGDASTATTSSDWESYVRETPTVSGGPGFGGVAALVAVLAAVLLARRRE